MMKRSKMGMKMMKKSPKRLKKAQPRPATLQRHHDQPRRAAQVVLQPSFLTSEDLAGRLRVERLVQTTTRTMRPQILARRREEAGFGGKGRGMDAGGRLKGGPRTPLGCRSTKNATYSTC